jgi:2-amino-4-hydroxy-6-hydroxymethyldihydropteridine diphosphokinase
VTGSPRGELVRRTGLLGLGSNVGERREHLQGAVAALPAVGVEVLASSSTYDTDPVGELPDQRSFLNACVRVATTLEPLELLAAVKGLERELGRRRGPRHGPRTIDIDILLLGELELGHELMTLPHEQLLHRRFVLVPALELDFDAATPAGERLADALAALDVSEGVRWSGPPLAVAQVPPAPLEGAAEAAAGSHSDGNAPGGTSPRSGGK